MSSSDDSCNSKYPLSEIEYPGVHDVLCGRGGHAISHPGNVHFRMLVEKYKARYVQASRYEKAQVTADVVRMWRRQTPTGRFLIMTDPSKGDASRWHDIGDKGASKKVAQCLRERNPKAEYVTATATVADAATKTASLADLNAPSSAEGGGSMNAHAPTSTIAYTPSNFPLEWKQRKQQKKIQKEQHHQHQHPPVAMPVTSKPELPHHPTQHPKHHLQAQRKPRQRQKQQQSAQRHQKQRQQQQQQVLQKQVAQTVEEQVQIAEQEVKEAQRQVDDQAQQLQQALQHQAQQQVQQAALNQQALNQQAQQQALNQQAYDQQVQQQLLNQQAYSQQQHHQEEQDRECEADAMMMSMVNEQQDQMDFDSMLESPVMWDSPLNGEYYEDETGTTRDNVAQSMPSAANLTKHAFDDEPTSGSSDDTLTKACRLLYGGIESFSDTSSEDNHNGTENGDGTYNPNETNIARSSAFAPD